jgi:hypothetical protein
MSLKTRLRRLERLPLPPRRSTGLEHLSDAELDAAIERNHELLGRTAEGRDFLNELEAVAEAEDCEALVLRAQIKFIKAELAKAGE